MNRKLFFEDGSVVEVSINVTEEGKMAKIALQKLIEFLDDDLIDDPRLAFQEEEVEADLDIEDEDLALEDEDLALEDEDWLDDEEVEDDWGDEDEEDLAEVWDREDDLRWNRAYQVGRSGVYPASAEEAPGDAEVRGLASWGHGERGAAGYEDSSTSEVWFTQEERRKARQTEE